jgi:predicted TIM-barrel fold metal-dependent hydrolase
VTPPGKLDVHAHYLPEPYRQALERAGHGQPDGMPQIPAWSAAGHVALMDRLGIAAALLSVSSPGVHLADGAATRELAREVNEAGRRAVVDHPGRFGLLGSLPLPDVDAAMAEITRCVDDLEVDGFVLLTHVGDTYLGDPEWDPVFAELDRRGARVLIHPTSPVCWEHTSLGRPRPMLEFLFDTTRAVVNLVLNGVIARHPGLRVIVPHAGATLPVIADRVAAFSLALGVDASVDVLRDLGSLEFDLAGMPIPASSTRCSRSRRSSTSTTAATSRSRPTSSWRRRGRASTAPATGPARSPRRSVTTPPGSSPDSAPPRADEPPRGLRHGPPDRARLPRPRAPGPRARHAGPRRRRRARPR